MELLKLGYDVVSGKIEENTLNFDLNNLPYEKIDVICVTHYFGYTCNMDLLSQICKGNDIILIEDCSHCHGGQYNGKPLGSFGDLSVFSLQGSKFVSGGEGGLVLCDDPEYFKEICEAGLSG